MKKIIEDSTLIQKYRESLGGVFLFADLATLFAEPHKTAVYRRIADLENARILQRFIKGVYVTSDFNKQVLNQKICPQSYISFGNILSESLIIGVRPQNQIDAVKPGKTRIHESSFCVLRQFGASEHLIFGYETFNGINKATPEKALLDTLYFYQHGVEFPFDVYSDINWERVDNDIMRVYLQEYKNPKFLNFVQGMMHDIA